VAVPYLSAVGGVDSGPTTFRLEQRDHAYLFGRTRRCEFRVNTSEVSREHASFTRRADGIYVNDLGSVNGVLVNNTRVSEFKLFDGDLIQVGTVKLRLFDPTDEKSPRASTAESAFAERTGAPAHAHGGPAHAHGGPGGTAPRVREERSTSFSAPAAPSEFHPAIAGALEQEEGYGQPHVRRPSVRVRIVQTWESSSRFRYGIVIVAASVLAVCAVIVGFRLAG
jgi:pSer/pThr/pTyr-binding forkhead associated (FHA) protein